jgi:hypothetical protein
MMSWATSGHALFSNGLLHEEILRLLADVPPHRYP